MSGQVDRAPAANFKFPLGCTRLQSTIDQLHPSLTSNAYFVSIGSAYQKLLEHVQHNTTTLKASRANLYLFYGETVFNGIHPSGRFRSRNRSSDTKRT